jgi:hypothetical protein
MNGVDAVVLLRVMISVPLKPEYTPMPPEMENTPVFLMPKSKMVFYFWWKSFSIRNCWWFNFLASIGEIISRNAKTICQRINAVCSCSG